MAADLEHEMEQDYDPWLFEENVNEFAFKPDDVLAPHRQQTIDRMNSEDTVLCALSSIDCDELQEIGVDGRAGAVGSRLNATFAWSTAGIPIGVLRCAFSTKSKRVKTQSWLDGLRDVDNIAKTMHRKTRVFCTLDWNTEIYDFLEAQRGLERIELILRARRDPRLKQKQDRLFKAMRNCPLAGEIEIFTSRTDSEEEVSIGDLDTPIRFEVHFRTIALAPANPKAGPLMRVSTIYLREKTPPEGADRIEWYLVTTAALDSVDCGRKLVEYYILGTCSERIMECLTIGCSTEETLIERTSLLHCALTLNVVTAWRLVLMLFLGISKGETHPGLIFNEDELEILSDYAHEFDMEFVNLGSALRIMAAMGDWTEQEYEMLSPYEVLWLGYKSLRFQAGVYEELNSNRGPV